MKTLKLTEIPRGDDPASMTQQDHLLIAALRYTLQSVFEFTDADLFVSYSTGIEPSVRLGFVVTSIDDHQMRLLHALQTYHEGDEASDGYPAMSVDIYSCYWDPDKQVMVDLKGKFEVSIEVKFHVKQWNRICSDVHEEDISGTSNDYTAGLEKE